MTRFLFYLTITILLGTTLACEKELVFERGQTAQPRLYANCILNPDSVFRVHLGYTVNITDPIVNIQDKIDAARNALIIIQDTLGTFIDTLVFVEAYNDESSFLIFESENNERPKANTTYKLEVSEPFNPKNRKFAGLTSVPSYFDTVKAMPFMPLVQVIHTDPTFRITLEWDNPITEKNSYVIEAIHRFTNKITGDVTLTRASMYSTAANNDNGTIADPLTNEFLYIFTMDRPGSNTMNTTRTDIAILTEPHEQEIASHGQNNITSELIIRVHNMNKAAYAYYKEVESYRKNNNSSIFALPVVVQGNVQGVGLFGGRVTRETVFTIP